MGKNEILFSTKKQRERSNDRGGGAGGGGGGGGGGSAASRDFKSGIRPRGLIKQQINAVGKQNTGVYKCVMRIILNYRGYSVSQINHTT